MLRKYLNYILFGLVVLAVVGAALRHSQYVHGLVVGMSSSDSKVRSASALELVKTEQFSDSITGESIETRLHAAEALESLGNDSTVVQDKTVKDSVDYRAAAVKQALGLLKDTDSRVRDRTILTLQRIGDSTPGNLSQLVIGIGDGDNAVRKGVRLAFTSAGVGIGPKPNVVENIIARMKADDPTRGPGGDILGSQLFVTNGANCRSLPLLIGFLTDKDAKGYKADEALRSGAADALGKIGDPGATTTLINSMHSDGAHVRRIAIGAIALIADASGEAALTEAVTNPDDDKQARSQAASGLGKIGSSTSISVLINALADKDQDIRGAAIAALARSARQGLTTPLKANVIRSVVSAVQSPIPSQQSGAIDALRAALAPGGAYDATTFVACEALIKVLRSPGGTPQLRASAATALGFPGDKLGVTPLIAQLHDSSGDVSIASRDALAAIGPDSTSALAEAINGGGVVAYYAAQALSLQGVSALNTLQRSAANSANPVGQRWAAVALGEIGVSQARQTLVKLSTNPNQEVALVAREQLNRLGSAE